MDKQSIPDTRAECTRRKRAYAARPDGERCTADRTPLRGDGKNEGARCMLPIYRDGLCWIHWRKRESAGAR